ncbi:MAG: Gfo/Idh/MocA family oxidoreductase, partial [Planctomycetes bacterium]|nr:Gfo/Idh/MocA family oxidoreductase [Planctomycetota bacterium]
MPGFGGWFGQKKLSGGGPLIDLGVHRLDLALWLMGYPKPEYVMGSTYNPIATAIAKKQNKIYDVEDLAVAMIKFKNNATMTLEASWAANIKEVEKIQTRLLGDKGGLFQYNLDGGYTFAAEMYKEQNGCQVDVRLKDNFPIEGAATSAMDHLVDSIVQDKPHMATGEEGVIVMEILDALYKSAADGKPVKIGK